MDWRRHVRSVLHEAGSRGVLPGTLLPRYAYNFRPAQLCRMLHCLDETRPLGGCIVEIGCAEGHTTLFLDQHLTAREDDRSYVCIDTFAGFTREDVAFERRERHKEADYRAFAANDPRWFRATLEHNGVTRVSVIEADVNDFEFATLGAVSFALVDVDLERPVASALEGLAGQMVPGGIVMVDDCRPGAAETHDFDGAYEAVLEFTAADQVRYELVEDKLAVMHF
jgi:O-methyltransferase